MMIKTIKCTCGAECKLIAPWWETGGRHSVYAHPDPQPLGVTGVHKIYRDDGYEKWARDTLKPPMAELSRKNKYHVSGYA